MCPPCRLAVYSISHQICGVCAELIARSALTKRAIPNAELVTDALERNRATQSQIGLSLPQRAENIRGAFRVAHPSRVSGRDVLLLDGVRTTGATASECAGVLKTAGARKIWVATVARRLKSGGTNLDIEPEFETAARAS